MSKLQNLKELLYTAAYYPQEIENFLSLRNKSFLKFDPVLAYLQTDYIFRDGMEGTLSEYAYEKRGGHRRQVNYRERPCRLNTYGNSYTQCAQVSDGETWQEVLAAHFREPIRNFGVGGHGVYHAYRRLLRNEVQKNLAADHLILNIWDDDHMRNIDAARWIRVGWMCRHLPRGGGKDAYPVHGFPWAHMRYDLKKGTFVEFDGLCKKDSDLRKLVGKENFYNAFKDDSAAHLFALREGGDAPVGELEEVAEAFGLKVNLRNPKTRQKDACKLHLTYGMRSSQWIIEKLTAWAAKNKRKVMILLSYDVPQVAEYLRKGTRFDDEMLTFLEAGGYTYVDTLKKVGEEYKAFKPGINNFLSRLYVARAGAQVFGHYTPAGNFWFAYAIRKELVDWLNPKPPAYQ